MKVLQYLNLPIRMLKKILTVFFGPRPITYEPILLQGHEAIILKIETLVHLAEAPTT